MSRRLWQVVLATLLALFAVGAIIVVAQVADASPPADSSASYGDYAQWYAGVSHTQLTPTDFITVTSTDDGGGMSERCNTHSPCTLRRAINQVRWYSNPGRVFRIAFDLETGDPGYDAGHGVWVIDVDSDSTSETFAFREFGRYGQVIVDGTTQPIGRDLSIGPRVVLRGDNKKGAFNLTGGNNVVRGLAFQGFADNTVHIPATNSNLIEENWFGLTITGTGIYLRNPLHPEDGSGEAGIYAQMSGSDGTTIDLRADNETFRPRFERVPEAKCSLIYASVNNTIQGNVLVGFKGSSINVQGDHNSVLSNTVGTYADGTVPEVRPERKCRPNARYYNWFAGAGIDVFGTGNLVAHNRLVGMLFQSNDPLNTPDDALSVTGRDHVVRHNIIGVASDGTPFGVCGEGIHVGGVSGAHFIQVITNTVVGAQGEAGIFVTAGELGYDLDGVTVQGNVIEDSAKEAFKFGDKVPAALREFNPAAVTEITSDGFETTISGSNGADSLCEECMVELFLDHIDMVTETLESLGKTVADGSGDWGFTLDRTLALTEGIRTASTTASDGQIQNATGTITYSAGTTTKISEIYTQTGAPDPVEPPAPVPLEPLPVVEPEYMPVPTPPSSYNLVITVTSTADPDDSEQYVCTNADYPGVVGKTNRLPCTLRQAIEEAESVMAADPSVRPVLIRFDISDKDPGYDDELDVWVIQITDTLKTDALPTLGSTDVNKSGQVVIDGDTQPGGRKDGPKIVLRGPANRKLAGHGLVVNGDNNVIRGIVFQDLRMVLQLNHAHNIVEDNWFGLTTEGLDIYLKNEEAPEDGSGQSGITVAAAGTNTLIQDNVLAGYRGAAINVESTDSHILNNAVGTRYDGTVPEVAWNRWCRPNARYHNWFGGAGVEIGGKRNRVIGNRIAGLLWYSADPINTPDDALSVTGEDHLVQENVIGVDADGEEVGSCGRGLVVDARYTRVMSNTVIRTVLEPFRINGTEKTMNALYYQGNLSWDSAPIYLEWGNLVPESRSIFTPAQVLSIDVAGGSTTIAGSNHPDAPCPYCQVELFLEDLDEVTETLESLARTQADVDGDWSVTLARTLALTEGVRTASTILNYGVIEQFDFPSTSRLSEVYSRTGYILPPPPPEPDPAKPPTIPEVAYLSPPKPPATHPTVIVVTTTDDTNTSQTCADTTADNCTLRRAINQVETLTAAQRPALIAFDIPLSDEGYDVGGYWVITLATDLPAVEGGQVTIDGTTQTGGRSTGPKVIVRRGTSTGAKLRLGETQFEGGYVLKGLGWQGVEVHMTGDGNVVAHNWLGQSEDGDEIYLYNNDPSKQNHAIIVAGSSSDQNHIHHNALAGSSTNAINLQGDDNLVELNTIGTLADGTIPVETIDPEDICIHTQLTGNWYGGGGIYLGGKRNRVMDNTMAGLMLYGSAQQTQPPAIELVGGLDHLVQGNRIGVDAAGTAAWTCGPAVDNTDASFTSILSNTIVNGYQQGIFVDGTVIAINATTMQGNVISNTVTAIEFGESVPEALSLFAPALVTQIDGVAVTGTDDDPCPYCYVDVFLDDDDSTVEALAYLGTTTADVNGDWSFVLPAELENDEGLRTISTARTYGVMQYFEVGTSSGFSMLFQPEAPVAPSGVTISGPPTSPLERGVLYNFVASVSPVNATLPITYTWEATDHSPQTVSGGVTNDIDLSWTLGGTKLITVSVDNGVGSPVTDSYSVEVESEPEPGVALSSVTISGPTTPLEPGVTYNFVASVSPVSATLPITYTWEATDHTAQVVTGGGLTDEMELSWTLAGSKQIRVTVDNGVGRSVTDSYSVEVQKEEEDFYIFLPLVMRRG
jgi:hypothetical protein